MLKEKVMVAGMKEEIEIPLTYWDLEISVSDSFNRLKAKSYNLIESSIPNKEQKEAMKGLLKGFFNDEYKNVQREIREISSRLGIVEKSVLEGIDLNLAEPLENRGN